MGAGPGAGRGWARSERCSAQGPPAHLGRRRALSDTEEEQSAAPRWGAPTSPGLMNIGVRGRGLCGTGAWIEKQRSPGACQRPQLHGHHATERRDTWSTRPPVDLGRKEGYRGQSVADSRPPETRSVTYGAWETQSLACVRISQIRS